MSEQPSASAARKRRAKTDDDPVLTAINDLWFEWSGRKGRGSAEFTRAVAQEARNALVRLLADRQRLLPPVPEGTEDDSDGDPFAVGFAAAKQVIRDADI